MTALHHMTRLRTLTIDVEEGDPRAPWANTTADGRPLAVLPTPAPPPLRHLVIDSGNIDVQVSCPPLVPGAVVQLRSGLELILTDAPAHLVGCRLEVYSSAVKLANQGQDDDGTPQTGSADLMDHLFRWFRSCGADCILLLPACEPEAYVRLHGFFAYLAARLR